MQIPTAQTRDDGVTSPRISGSLAPWLLALLLPILCAARSHNWIDGTIVQISQGYDETGANTTWNPIGTSGTTRRTGFKYSDYTIQSGNKLFVLRSNSTVFSHVLSDVGNLNVPHTGDHSSAAVPVSIGEQVKVAIEGNKGWILDWKEKEHPCSVVRQMMAPAEPPPQLTGATARAVNTQTPEPRPTIRREDDLERAGPLPVARSETLQRPTLRRVDEEPPAASPGTGTQPVSKELAEQSAAFLQRRLHVWQAADAQAELGQPTGHWIATDQHDNAYGEVFAFPDPTQRYQRFDLTFDFETKKLREIRVYPRRVTLDECKAIWGDKFEMQQRTGGLRLYVYRDQRVSVLARESGEVLSFDLW